jgi:protease YdgD
MQAAPVGSAATTHPGVSQVDRRVPVPLDRAPWIALVRVQTELGARCSGFLVAPQVVMTAAHCLFLPRVRRFIRPESVHVLVGYEAGHFRAHARVTGFTVAAGYRPLDEAGTAGADRAVLVLERRVAPVEDVLAEAPVPAMLPASVRLGGYGQDRDEIAVADPACRLTGEAADGQGRPLLAHDCDAARGTSGAPLLWQQPDGRWAAVGIQVAATAGGAGGFAVPLGLPAAVVTPSGRSADR